MFTSQLGTADSGLATATLGFGVYVNGNEFIRNVSQTILSDSATLDTFFANAADRIFFFGAYPGPLGGPSGEIGQLATHNYTFEDCTNTLFSGVANTAGYSQAANIVQYIGFTDRKFQDASNILFNSIIVPAASRAAVSFSADATNTFSWNSHDDPSDAAKRVYLADNVFGFSQTLLNSTFEDLWNTFVFDGSLDTVGTDFGSDMTQGFIKQHVSFRIQGSDCPEKEYTPYIGESGDSSYPSVSASAPTLGEGVLTLTYPRVSPTSTLVLKNPDFGNSDVIRFAKVDRRTRGGDRKIFSDLGWGSTQSFELTITNICETTATIDGILDFLNTSLGEEIGLLDWENRQWKGIIVVPETNVTPQVGGHSVQIVFEGELA